MTSLKANRALQIVSFLGELDSESLLSMGDFAHEYYPDSVAYPVRIPKYHDSGLIVVVAEAIKNEICALMVCRKDDVMSCILTINVLVRSLSNKTKLNSKILLPEESPNQVYLSHTDPEFFPDCFLVAKPRDFGFDLLKDPGAFFIVGSDDNVEGELKGLNWLVSVQERTPMGITPPGIGQPKLNANASAKVVLRKKS